MVKSNPEYDEKKPEGTDLATVNAFRVPWEPVLLPILTKGQENDELFGKQKSRRRILSLKIKEEEIQVFRSDDEENHKNCPLWNVVQGADWLPTAAQIDLLPESVGDFSSR